MSYSHCCFLKIYWFQSNFENKAGDIMLLDLKLYYKSTGIKLYGVGIKTDILIDATEWRAQK